MISRVKPRLRYKDKDFLHEKYVVERLLPSQIAALSSSSRTTIMKYLRQHNLLKKEAVISSAQVGYGQMKKGRARLVNRREQQVIAKMKALRASGWSYWKIAEVLNAWGIRTKTGKGKWSSKGVHQILVRVGNGPSMT